jgi:diguanylate cyclase (GGDEF)-like protein
MEIEYCADEVVSMRSQIRSTFQRTLTGGAVFTLSSSMVRQTLVDEQVVIASMATKSPGTCLQVSSVDEFEVFQPVEASSRTSPMLMHFAGSAPGCNEIDSSPIASGDGAFQGSSVTEPDRIRTWQNAPTPVTAAGGSTMANSAGSSSLPSPFAAPAVPSETRLTILVIDDEPLYQELIADILGTDYKILVADGGITGLQIATNNVPQLILLDLMMPGIDGYQVFRCLKADRRTCDVPIIFITARGDVEAETKGLNMGAVDYIAKPINPDLIRARVKTQVTVKLMRDELAMLAATDGLTGLANRSHFDGMLAYEYARHLRSGTELSLIMLDIDQFKAFNDTYGHISGDECLRKVARAMTKTVSRATDLVARYGGEEFVILLPETGLKGAVVLAERVRDCISDLALPHRDSSAGRVTASLGVVSGRFLTSSSIVDVLTEADLQLYAAKAGGRNRVAYRAIERFGLTH